MRQKQIVLFFTAYFMIIFLWLSFCYKQVQKAWISAGYTEDVEEAYTGWPDGQDYAEKIMQKLPFFSELSGQEEGDTEKREEDKTEISGKEEGKGEEKAGEASGEKEEEGISGEVSESGHGGKEGSASAEEENASEKIRVVLTGADGIYHEKVVLQFGGETLEIKPDSVYFAKTDVIRVRTAGEEKGAITVASIEKNCGAPGYEGYLEIRKEEEKLVLINEVPLESYVKGVLPSEMPASYPLEALKAQAVCARTYVKMKQEQKAYPQYNAAVDDSVSCQVYQNLKTSPQSDQAVEETAGVVLEDENGAYAECFYYSTSCGRGTTKEVWHGGETGHPGFQKTEEDITLMNQEFFDYIREGYEEQPESSEAFYRWNYKCESADQDKIWKRCRQRQAVDNRFVWMELSGKEASDSEAEIKKENLGEITAMDIVERKEGGVADCLRITCKKGKVYVWGEYNIRYVLAQGGSVICQDQTEFQAGELLPSAFLSLQSICNEKGNMIGYIVVGGGFGHGVGMSQNGAKHMAAAGNGYQEILAVYYPEDSLITE